MTSVTVQNPLRGIRAVITIGPEAQHKQRIVFCTSIDCGCRRLGALISTTLATVSTASHVLLYLSNPQTLTKVSK